MLQMSDEEMDGFVCRLRGLPWSATPSDIIKFFNSKCQHTVVKEKEYEEISKRDDVDVYTNFCYAFINVWVNAVNIQSWPLRLCIIVGCKPEVKGAEFCLIDVSK